ncbi:hypothetical protein ACN47E_004860 [Coniothyrium glycines]
MASTTKAENKAEAKPKQKARRQPAKRDGPPELHFVTATDPAQFKNKDVSRKVRSQVMGHYRYLSRKEKEKEKRRKQASEEVDNVDADQATSIVTTSTPSLEDLVPEEQNQSQTHGSGSAAWLDIVVGADGQPQCEEYELSAILPYRSRFNEQQSNTNADPSLRVLNYEYSDAYEQRHLRMVVDKIAMVAPTIGDGVDPFKCLPPFEHPELDALFLVRRCIRAFASTETIVKWLPSMLSHPHLILSSTVLASTWLDMQDGLLGDSKRTALVNDATLMVILHLLAGEMWNCNESTLNIHEAGVGRSIHARGGINNLENRVVADVAVGVCYHCDILCEKDILPVLQDWTPPAFSPLHDATALPESPLFCPRADFSTITHDPRCATATLELLRDMRELTDLVISHTTNNLETPYEKEKAGTQSHDSCLDYERKAESTYAKLVLMPSAYASGHASTGDWLYEACRIAALIYTTAIILRVNFSVAADPAQNPRISNLEYLNYPRTQGSETAFRLTSVLYEVLEKTDTDHIWSDMAGVLYWICAVGAAAARTSITSTIEPANLTYPEKHILRARRCLVMYATRAMIVLVFQHPTSLILSQQKLLRVQEIIGATDRRRMSAWYKPALPQPETSYHRL